MARPRTFNKEELLEKILHIIWQHGSSGLSLDELAKSLNLSKTSLYSAFGNKNELLSQCLDLYERLYEQPMLASFQGDKISDCMSNFLTFSRKRFGSLTTPPGCFMFNCAIEGSALSIEFQTKVNKNNRDFRRALEKKVLHKTGNKTAEQVNELVELLLVNLFGLASASKMQFPLSGSHLILLDKLLEDKNLY